MARAESPMGLVEVLEPDPAEEGVHMGVLVGWAGSEESTRGGGQSSLCRVLEHT